MPCTEKKGRFTVSISETGSAGSLQQQGDGPAMAPACSTQQPEAGSPRTDAAARAVKRGRFLVSCSSSPARTASTLSCQGGLVQVHGSLQPAAPARASRSSSCSSEDSQHTGMQQAAAGPGCEVSSPAQVSSPCCPAAPAGGSSPARQSPEPRRVRFSETAEGAPPQDSRPPADHAAAPAHTQVQVLQQQPAADSTQGQVASKRKQQQAEAPLKQLRHTRSYCSGRFTIQEAVAVQASMRLHRSTSAPECAAAGPACMMSGSMSSCSSMQSLQGPFATFQGSISPSNSDSSFPHAGLHPCADLLAANQLMSGLLHPQHAQHAGAAAASPMQQCFPAAAFAGMQGGGLFATQSVPVPVLGTASSEEEGSLIGSCMSCDGLAPAEPPAGPLAGPFGGAPAPSSTRSSSSKKPRAGSSSCGGSTLLLGSCYSAGADVLVAAAAAAAAAAAGQHQHHQHMPPKRSASISYFRRGRFLVQTTMG